MNSPELRAAARSGATRDNPRVSPPSAPRGQGGDVQHQNSKGKGGNGGKHPPVAVGKVMVQEPLQLRPPYPWEGGTLSRVQGEAPTHVKTLPFPKRLQGGCELPKSTDLTRVHPVLQGLLAAAPLPAPLQTRADSTPALPPAAGGGTDQHPPSTPAPGNRASGAGTFKQTKPPQTNQTNNRSPTTSSEPALPRRTGPQHQLWQPSITAHGVLADAAG